MVLPVVAMLILAGVLIWLIHDANTTVLEIETFDTRIALATLIERLSVDEESGLRGYQTTSDRRFLEPYLKAQVPLEQNVAKLHTLTDAPTPHLDVFIEEHRLWQERFAEPLIAQVAAG